MNRGVLQSLPVQQMLTGSPNWWNINHMRPPSQPSSPFLIPPSNLFPQYTPPSAAPPPPPSSSSSSLLPLSSSSWHDNNQELPESWSQFFLGGLVGEEDKSGLSHVQGKKLENWEAQLLQQASNAPSVEIKQENSAANSYVYGLGNGEYHAAKPTWSQIMPASSPKSCVTSLGSNMLEFSSNKLDGRHPPPDRSSECNSTATGGVIKKARVQPSSTQSTFKVRKEKLGDRITALHQLVSPFGKTDTASVLLEAIGYIRFLQNQIEALSLPYLGSGSGNMWQHQQSVQGERNCLFPEDPGQLLNDNCMKKKGAAEQDSHEESKDLRSRGLCLVPISCTLQVGSDNGADYWAPALGGGFR
ncbi:transcription factor bHLH68 isoform X1 [Camellia sinensis]|uniref:transcription factor bHLH68 isoform X1 n=1 Tax=Camellia sinensis TaxID=4442 RepID=UPI0010368412|nr:transcription factor bHLH68 isoform X1 [Camellia sinensis]